ncbi:MAG: DUF3108 domain-containing protein [Pseudomonadota bacterium]
MLRAALLFFFCLVAPAYADRYALGYDGAAVGVIDLGHATVDADVSADSYQISATMRTVGLMNWFERTNITASASGDFRYGGVHWRHYDLDHYYGRKHRVIAMQTADDGAVTSTITPTYRIWGDPAASDEQIRRSRDPLSTLIAMAIDVGQSQRCSGSYPTFDGRFHYLLSLAGGTRARYNGGGYRGPILRCTLSYVPVAGYEADDRGRLREPHGQVWFALVPDANFAPPIRMVTPLVAGGATIRLTSWHRAIVSVADTN